MPATGKFHNIARAPIAAQGIEMRTGERFDVALNWLRTGRKVARRGWNGQGMYCYLVKERYPETSMADSETALLVPMLGEGVEVDLAPRIDMRYANGKFGVWTPTIEDILADDWSLLQ